MTLDKEQENGPSGNCRRAAVEIAAAPFSAAVT